MVAHLILNNESIENILEKIIEIQTYIYEKSKNINMVPEYFKIREEFPYAKSGKRDIKSLTNEDDGFLYNDKSYLKLERNNILSLKRK